MKAPDNVRDAIRASVKVTLYGYRGVLKVHTPWGRYTKTVGIERTNENDARDDAIRARNDYISVGNLP